MGGPIEAEPSASVPKASRWVPATDALPAYPQANSKPSGVASPDPAANGSRVAGQVIGGRYRLLAQLARGAETEAWSAEHVELGRSVVIKFVHTDGSGVSDRLLQQARVLAKIRHPHVAEFSDFGRTDAGEPYFVMEQLVGRTLQQLLDQRGGMSWARAVAIVQQVGEALAAGHAQGVVHRDLRPANVFLIETGQPGDFAKLVDFGLASDPDPRKISAASAGFASPEQASGSLLDPRSDVYALGCLLFALIAGDPPFVGSAEQVLWAQINTPPKSLRERAPKQFIPDELLGILTRCLEKLPARRFNDTRELVAALGQFARLAAAASHSGSPVVAPEPQASRSQVMGFAGRPAPKDADELDRSLRPSTRSTPIVAQKKLGVLAIVGIALGVALAVGGAGIGVYMLVQMLIADEGSPAREVAPREPTPEPRQASPEPRALEGAPAPSPAPAPSLAGPVELEREAVPAGGASKPRKRSAAASEPSQPSQPIVDPALAPVEPPADPEPAPIKPTTKPESKANDKIGHDELLDPWG
ncbi:serine/threonine-protein kinase [Nannocystaceae bacterium ST9]